MDDETAEDGLHFTPPDTPSQHYSRHSTPMADGEAMGNSPSKDDAEGAGGSQGSSQMSQGGVLASLGPLTSPSNPTANGDGTAGGGSGAVAKDVAAADEDKDSEEERTPSIDYNQDTEKFVPSARASADAAAAAPAPDGDCMSPLTMTEDQRESGKGNDEEEDHDDGSDDEGEMEVNSEDEAAIAQDGIYQPADGIAVGTIIGGRGRGNQGDQANGSDGNDDDDDEEFGSMESALAQSGGLLTQGGGFGDDSDDDSSDSDGDGDGNSASAAAAQDASDDESDTEERSQNLLAPDDNANTDEGREQEGSATEPPASVPSDTEQTATADELGASTAEVEAEPMDVDTGMFVTGLTEQTESQTQPTLAGGAADTEETGEGEDADGTGTANDGDDSADQQQQHQQEEDIDDEEMVEGLTEETETQTQPAVSADAISQDGARSDVAAAAAADSSEVVPASPSAAIPLVEAEIVGLTEQSEWSQQESQKTAGEKLQAGEEEDSGSAKDVAVQKSDSVAAAAGDDDEGHESVLGQKGADETAVRDSQSITTKESSNAESDNTKAAALSETHSPKQQLLTDAELMPPPATTHRGSPTKSEAAGAQAEESSQRSLASKLAEGSEDTYDSFGDLPVFSGDTEQMVMPSMDRFTANEDSPAKPGCSLLQSTSTSRQEVEADGAVARSQGATNSQAEEKHSPSKSAAEMLASEGGAPSPQRESQTENSKNDDAEESQEGTGASSSSAAAELGDLYDNAETERFRQSADNNDDPRNAEEVDTDASTPLVSHTQTYIEGRSNAGFSYPRNDELEPVEEKKIDSPSPAVAATPLQDSCVNGPKDSQGEAEDMDVGSSMRSVDEEVVNGAPAGAEAGAACAQTTATTPASSKKDHAGDPVTPAGAGLESEAATVMLSTTPASSKKMGRDTVTPAKASEATTVILSTTPASTKKGAENIAEDVSTTKNVDNTPPPSSNKKPATPASSERTTAESASSPNKSGLSFSSSPHSQPLLSPVNVVAPSSNFNSERSSLLKSVEASSKAVAKHDHLKGKGPSQDDIVDSDEDTCDDLGHADAVESRSLPKDVGDSHTNAAPTAGDDKEEKKNNVAAKPISASGINSSATKRTSAPPAQWIHKHQKSNHKKNAAADTARGEKDHSESEVEEEFDTEGGSEPTPRLFLPSNAKQRAAERKKELEVEADAFSSSDDDGMVARNARTAAIRRNSNGNHALQDTQDSPSESEDDEDLDDKMKNNPFAQSARTSSARKRLKKRLRRDASKDEEQSPPPSRLSRDGKKKAKRKSSSSDYQVQDSLAMLSADASKHESSDEEEKEFQIDGIGDDASVSSSTSSDNGYDVMPSQNTIDIDNLIGQAKGALQKFTEARKSDTQVAKLKRKVERLERKCSKLKEGYNKVRAENAVLKKSLEKKITQNQEMKVLLTRFNKMAQAGTLPAMDDGNDAASASESDSSIDSQTASPPAKKRAKKSISSSKNPSARKRQANSTATAPVVVPPSSIKARGRLPVKTEVAASSISGRKRRKEQEKSRSMRDKDESSDDEKTTLANLDTTPKAKRVGKKLNFEKHKSSNTASKGKATGGKGRKSTPAVASTASNASIGRSRSRRGVSTRDLIPKGMEHIRVSTIWNFLRDERGWTWRSGPEPYNNVYVRPGIEHLNVVGINQDFYEDGVYLYAEAKKAGFVVQPIQEEVEDNNMEEEEEIGDVDSDAAGDDGDEDSDSAAEQASIQSGQRGRRRGGYAQKQVNAATSPSGAHVSLSIGDHSADERDDDDDDDDDEEYEDEEEEEQNSASEQEDVDGENNADEGSVEEAVEEEVEESEVEEEEEEVDDDDDAIASLDDTALCGDAKILTPRSVYLCAKFIRKFAKLSGNDSSFINLLWKPMWDMLKDGQGGKDKDDLKWGWAKSKGQLAQRSYWYVAPQSKGSEGKQGVDYFETEEAVVLKVLQEIQQVDPSLLDASIEKVEAFEVVLRRAAENNVAYSESRNNPDIGAGRRNRRKTHEASPFVYSARDKKTKPSPTKAKAKTKTTKKGANKPKKNTKAAASPKQKPTSPLKMSPSPRKAKSVAFSEPPPLSQNTMEGVENLLMMNASGAASNTNSTSAFAAPAATLEVANDSRAVNPSIPDYEDIATPKGIEALRAARLRSLQDVTPSPKKRSALPASASKSSATSSGRKRQKTGSPQKEEAPSSIDTRLSQVPYQLCDSLDEMSQSQSDASSTFTRRKSTKRGDNGKVLPFNGLSFIGSGLDTKHADIIKSLGGEYLTDVSTLDDTTIYGSLFFVSNVQQRRKLKYILASALGVPMLHYSWLKAIQNKYEAIENSDEDEDSKADAIKQLPYNSDLFKAMRLPVGLSIKTGLYHLQKARHAKRWCRPGQENGKLIFKGLKLTVALENSKFETQWEAVLRAAGATIVKSSTLKSGKKCHLDALLVDRNSLPPHTTAVPSNISRCMNFVKSGNAKTSGGIAKIPIIDLSWALQCIVERERLAWDTDERYILYSDASNSNENGDAMYEMKVKIDEIPVRFECGDIVEFGRTKSTERIGRIVTIEGSKRTCATRSLEIQLLDRNGNFELVDGGEDATRVRINENELRRHITLLGAKDFKDIKKDGYLPSSEKETHIFLQKKCTKASKWKL